MVSPFFAEQCIAEICLTCGEVGGDIVILTFALRQSAFTAEKRIESDCLGFQRLRFNPRLHFVSESADTEFHIRDLRNAAGAAVLYPEGAFSPTVRAFLRFAVRTYLCLIVMTLLS